MSEQITVTAVGDGGVGKTYMLMRFSNNTIPHDYIPTVFDTYTTIMEVDNHEYKVNLWDTAGQEDYERLRALSYTNTDCFLLCFAVNCKSSYYNVDSKWAPELKHHKKTASIILVGTKSDLREKSTETTISKTDCLALKNKIRAYKYMECSAYTCEGINNVFDEAVRSIIYSTQNKRKRRCHIL